MEQTVKKKIGVRDIMTIAAMMVITFLVAMIIGSFTLPFPAVYLYGSAGIDAFIGAIFYLVAANRVNKHGLLFAWAAVYGLIQGVMGYMFLIPYFLVVAVIAELTMIGKDTSVMLSATGSAGRSMPSATLLAALYRCGGPGTAIRKWL